MTYELNKAEAKTIDEICNTGYMKPILEKLEASINNNEFDWPKAFDHIYDIMINSKKEVENKLNDKQLNPQNYDIKQAMKSVAGNAFSRLIVYIFLKNKSIGKIKRGVFITSKQSEVNDFSSVTNISVNGQTQKLDADLIIYSLDAKKSLTNCAIVSLKTSLRERAAQTVKWKLLMEIAQGCTELKEKYKIEYSPIFKPLIWFVTVNFYNEINNPQQKGLLEFFDDVFIAKEVDKSSVKPLSKIINCVNKWRLT